jgi:general secretion pathway protein L
LKKYAYIEVLSFLSPELVDEKNSEAQSASANPFSSAQYRWLLTDDKVDVGEASYGGSDELLIWLSSVDGSPVLIIPGEKVVVKKVPYHEKEKRHFAKMLPYEVEDSVIDDVENLHFVIGEKNKGQATIAYVEREWFESALAFFQEQKKPIVRALIDFQCLQQDSDESIVWFNQERLLVHQKEGVGFSTAYALADTFLQNMLFIDPGVDLEKEKNDVGDVEQGETLSQQYKVYVSNDGASSYTVEKATRVFHTVNPEASSEFYETAPVFSLNNAHAIDFCTGAYAPPKNDSQQVTSWKFIGVLSLFSILLFVSVSLFEIYTSKQKILIKAKETEASYRKVIPQGVVRDPVRSLRNKLDELAGGDGKASEVVRLLSYVAPAIQSLDVDLLTINYNHKEATLRLSVQAGSFQVVEKLRTDIEEKGLVAELLSSNAVDNKFQARLRISMERF